MHGLPGKKVTFASFLRFIDKMADFLTEAFLRLRARMFGKAAGEDALQEAFVRLWRRYDLRSSGEAEALLQRTMRNLTIDAQRRNRTVPLEGDTSNLIAEQQDYSEQAQERESLFTSIEESLRNDISDIQRYIIRRHEYEGVSLEVIARELGMKAPAVRMQLSRARKAIRDKYNGQKVL